MLAEHQKINALILGASQGIGLGFVKSLLKDDRVERVFCTYRKAETARELFSLHEMHGTRVSCLQMDIIHESQIAAAIRKISDAVTELHLVLYCVGVLHEDNFRPEKSLRDLTSEHLIYSFQVNSIGAALVAKHIVPLFKRDSKSIFASISAKVGSIGDNYLGGWYGYRASKAALNMFMKTTAIEYRRRCPSTIVVALHPGTTDTRLSEPFQKNVPPEQLFSVERTVGLLTDVMTKLKKEDSGSFYSWNGNQLPW